jgi:CHASE3 domain sensor protein
MHTENNLYRKVLSLLLILVEALFSMVWYFFWIILLVRQKTRLITR